MPDAAELLATIAEGRAEAESLMLGTCKVTRLAVEGDVEFVPQILDETTMQYPEQGRVVVYQGRCRFQVKADINSNVVETTAGEREWTYQTFQMQTPVEPAAGETGHPADIRPDNVAEILTEPTDTSMVGRVFNIQGMYHKSDAVYRRFRVREVVQ